jgi:hypothetical protein
MAATTRRFELTLLPESFAISRLEADSPIPGWATQGPFFSVTRTGDELSVVCELSRVPAGVQSQPGWPRTDLKPNDLGASTIGVDPVRGWRVFKVHGPFVLSEVGVLSALAAPLAEAKISLFAVSTFDTDYLLVASETLSAAIAALERAGHTINRSKAE